MNSNRRLIQSVCVTALVSAWLPPLSAGAESDSALKINDSQITASVYVSDPEIVTPIGAAVDKRGRLFVVESHTHLRPAEYKGPVHDKIKVFWGETPEGRAAHAAVFADDLDEAMNLAFSPEGTLYVCTARGVYALPDDNHDDKADRKVEILRLENGQTYPHNQLLALTFSPDNWLYVTRGNVAGMPYAIKGTDGTGVSGYGDGGEVVKCRPDGSEVQRVATGFWNPFDLKFDHLGNLLLVDNDPDSRGPNRLVQIVQGGDYGYRALYGGSGLHPYQAWNGELPGTLPYAGGVGEAPSGLLDADLSSLPASYAGSVLVTIWGEHKITRHVLTDTDGVLTAAEKPFIQGGQEFRPVAIVASPDGAIFVTDWMLKDYPNHGHGRIWRLKVAGSPPSRRLAATTVKPEFIASSDGSVDERYRKLRDAAVSENIFRRHEAVEKMRSSEFRDLLQADLRAPDVKLRRAAFLAFRPVAADRGQDELIRRGLADPDPEIRIITLLSVGAAVRKDLEEAVRHSVNTDEVPMRLFEVWLATMQILRSDADKAYAAQIPGSRIKRDVDPALIDELVTDEKWPPSARAFAIPRLVDPGRPAIRAALMRNLKASNQRAALESIRSLATIPDPELVAEFKRVAQDSAEPTAVRAEAILALERTGDSSLVRLVDDNDPAIVLQSLRSLKARAAEPEIRSALAPKRASWNRDSRFAGAKRLLDELLDGATPRPNLDDVTAWQAAIGSGGDRDAGRRVFFSTSMICTACHRYEGRGGVIGPDLSLIGRTVDRNKLIHSILRPSDEVAPQFQGWEVTKKSGEVVNGLQAHVRQGGNVSIIPFDGSEILIPKNEVVGFQAMTRSLMPDGTAAALTVDEFRDLVAFLEGSK